jgi:hypothetical protein
MTFVDYYQVEEVAEAEAFYAKKGESYASVMRANIHGAICGKDKDSGFGNSSARGGVILYAYN